jgi:hypothetical protein
MAMTKSRTLTLRPGSVFHWQKIAAINGRNLQNGRFHSEPDRLRSACESFPSMVAMLNRTLSKTFPNSNPITRIP